jgi:glutamine amidotransferase
MLDETNVAVLDYGVNNVGSVVNMLRRLRVVATIAADPRALTNANAIVLPGIGAFDAGVRGLREAGLFDAILERAQAGIPLLGICLGMQLLSRGSEEGSLPGLALVPATTRKLHPPAPSFPVPHMGWNETNCIDGQLFHGFEAETPRFYYVHSYHVVCDDDGDVAARCSYGETFTAAVRRGNVFGTQFHPEKSHRFGKQVLANFVRTVTSRAHA